MSSASRFVTMLGARGPGRVRPLSLAVLVGVGLTASGPVQVASATAGGPAVGAAPAPMSPASNAAHATDAHAIGPPPAHTGGFGEPTCQICHEGDALNAFGGSVTILGLPTAWVPGRAYPVTIVLEAEETGVAGFQLAARFAEGDRWGEPAGSLAPVSPRVALTVSEGGQPYAHHTSSGTAPRDSNGSSWVVEWTAPAAGGAVAFHVAANSGNGDNSPLLDLIYVAEVTVPGPEAGSATRGERPGGNGASAAHEVGR
ncbi:MAG: hypothetical protein JSU98_14895 [Gemmatimonadales bacterium]|nr:MAG: hypothetical protein JSU98_14895 [Gemmatimonadales bacterium]